MLPIQVSYGIKAFIFVFKEHWKQFFLQRTFQRKEHLKDCLGFWEGNHNECSEAFCNNRTVHLDRRHHTFSEANMRFWSEFPQAPQITTKPSPSATPTAKHILLVLSLLV